MKFDKMKCGMWALTVIVQILCSSARADLQVFPLRVVVSDKDRSTQISVRHHGNKSMRYRITTVFYKMAPDGTMMPIDKPIKGESAEELFRYSPKEVLLEPNVEQVVRVMMRAPADLPEGEYRTHLRFEGIDDETDDATAAKSQNTQMMLKARMAVAIPVIVRKGNPQFKVSLANPKFVKGPDQKPAFSVEMKKEGNAIPYGDFEILSIPEKGEPKVVGIVNGVSSYISERTIVYPLMEAPKVPGKLKVTFKKPISEGATTLSSVETDLK